jgi:glycosyltransferase involved in cell wall biosynthesis
MVPNPLLSIIIPVYNEERTIATLLHRVTTGPYRYPDLQVIVVDDGSSDQTSQHLQPWDNVPGVLLLRHLVNQGKGAAVRTGLAVAMGVFTVIQDADLEYDPFELPKLIEPLRCGESNVVYGSRYLLPQHRLPWTPFRLAVCLMNRLLWLLFGQSLTDIATCYKAMPTSLYRQLDLKAERFELCAEITAKLFRRRERIREVPICYQPRTRAEGKKIGWRDALQYAWALLRWRFANLAGPVMIPGRATMVNATRSSPGCLAKALSMGE